MPTIGMVEVAFLAARTAGVAKATIASNAVRHEFLRVLVELVLIAVCEFTVKRDILSFSIAEHTQCRHKRIESL